ncbi:EscU/YscU/HrcU family type III secretion system export apparatus switch protein [Trinickia caryophylli]|uniref:Type III secretion protein U n=1 Tax=Trinickia caryophylli TaxID=28094 RepID=A0A1X7DYU5_TRICW|nr:EscU/YscU/HrcU family type III secretion system export apparatus switch protein [Trinickia caryophylli]PMS14118.1 hypothetical protein C0Z17_00835 [Trinickia caryophylli]TRX17817.1 EscU/YscU/HrcU family type III secretion system export apparatus switch protein [Trinickia caryophylli]WQE11415.1 EscU/YscU/HrcU family type III secretion system export apparatus switch protein [Trinickia caryophylli]SMF24327.1 type III secretion protein U [Trinickia caryophylli]GLU32577.1 hypothetical protein Bu
MSDKRLPPTEKRLRDARSKGDVPRSELLVAWIVMAACIEVGFAGADVACDAWLKLLAATIDDIARPFTLETVWRLAAAAVRSLAGAFAALGAVACLGVLAGTWISGGLPFAYRSLTPSMNRLDPRKRFKQIFSARNMTTVCVALAAAVIVALAGLATFVERLPLIVALARWHVFESSAGSVLESLHALLRTLLAALLVPAVLSALLARQQHRRTLRMSHRDLRDELKHTTGDPIVRARQHAVRAETMALPPALARPEHCAIVTNPEHLAVMLYYDGSERAAPIVAARGADASAERMTREAQTLGIPVFRFRALARRLFEQEQTGEAIPADCYGAVAIVYRLIEEIQALGSAPSAPMEIDDAFFHA